MPREPRHKFARYLGTAVLFVFFCSLTGRWYFDSLRSKERGSLVASMVREQARNISAQGSLDAVLDRQKGWPDDFLLLENWLILEALKNARPDLVADRLRDEARRHLYSPLMGTTLRRWDVALTRWSKVQRHLETLSPNELLVEGRRRQMEAMGYLNIGRSYDASALFLWSAMFLTRYIELAPRDSGVPEALYHLGNSYLRMRHALPLRIRGDRILNLCSELYPDSIWAKRAAELWRDEMGNEA